MVNQLRSMLWSLYSFIGSVTFALILIALTALLVIVGTLLESHADSHLYAARMIYDRPYFALLLWGFFFNILFAATKRWPFKTRHLPFLTTHLGLLMILAGALVKHYSGFQGWISLNEGSGSHTVSKSDTMALHLFKKGASKSIQYPLTERMFNRAPPQLNGRNPDGLQLQLLHYAPHAPERFTAWIKGDFGTVNSPQGSLSPQKVHAHPSPDISPIPSSGQIQTASGSLPLYLVRSSNLTQLLADLYAQHGTVQFKDRRTGQLILETSLREALTHQVELGKWGRATAKILAADKEFWQIYLQVHTDQHAVEIDFNGPSALLCRNCSTPHFGSSPLAIDLQMPPFLLIVDVGDQIRHLFAIHPNGNFWHQLFTGEAIDSLFVYGEGFGGYAVQASIPMDERKTREEREEALTSQLLKQLKQGESEGREFAPPLQMLQKACKASGVDFTETCLTFLKSWDLSHGWSYPIDQPVPESLAVVFRHLEWEDAALLHGAELARSLFMDLEKELQAGKSLFPLLQEIKWPLLEQFKQDGFQEPLASLTLMTQQIFAAAAQLPEGGKQEEKNPQEQAALLSLFLRAYRIHLHSILPESNARELEGASLTLESPLYTLHQELPALKKIEENQPALTLRLIKGKQADVVTLGFDRTERGMRSPALQGEYLLRFQSQQLEIPYQIRLRSARRLNYPNSSKPYSFESDLLITDRRTGEIVEKRVSMNNVYETWEGYRFYLSSISPQEEGSLKRIQLVVNHDPGKYWLTYPGAVILSCGILLLFWLNPYKKKPN